MENRIIELFLMNKAVILPTGLIFVKSNTKEIARTLIRENKNEGLTYYDFVIGGAINKVVKDRFGLKVANKTFVDYSRKSKRRSLSGFIGERNKELKNVTTIKDLVS